MTQEEIAVQETEAQTSTVSTEQTNQEAQPDSQKGDKQATQEEFKLPTTREEYDNLVKSAVNKEKTMFLKELGVKSVKEYKEQVSKAEEALAKHAELIKQNEDIVKQKETISQQYESLKQTSVLDKLGVKDEYRDDLLKLAKDKVTAENSFESVLKQLVETKYQYTVSKGAPKIGTEKTQTQKTDSDLAPELVKKYPWLGSNK